MFLCSHLGNISLQDILICSNIISKLFNIHLKLRVTQLEKNFGGYINNLYCQVYQHEGVLWPLRNYGGLQPLNPSTGCATESNNKLFYFLS